MHNHNSNSLPSVLPLISPSTYPSTEYCPNFPPTCLPPYFPPNHSIFPSAPSLNLSSHLSSQLSPYQSSHLPSHLSSHLFCLPFQYIVHSPHVFPFLGGGKARLDSRLQTIKSQVFGGLQKKSRFRYVCTCTIHARPALYI